MLQQTTVQLLFKGASRRTRLLTGILDTEQPGRCAASEPWVNNSLGDQQGWPACKLNRGKSTRLKSTWVVHPAYNQDYL